MANQNPWLLLAQAEGEPAESEGVEAVETAEEQAIVETGDTPPVEDAAHAETGFFSTEVLMLIALVILIGVQAVPQRTDQHAGFPGRPDPA